MLETMEFDNKRASLLEVTLVVTLAVSASLLRNAILSFSEFLSRSRLCYLVDFLLTPLFTLFAFTILSDSTHMYYSYTLITVCSFLLFILTITHNIHYFPGVKTILRSPFPSSFPFLSNARAYINLMACISILAVDFTSLFPQKFGKTHSYGTGLMDVGVGMFIAAHGTTSRYARRESPPLSGWREYWSQVYVDLRVISPIFILGLIRLALITFMHKNPPLYEYGAHWNFFFTIGCVRLLTAFILPLLPQKISITSCVAASIICLLYEYWLVNQGLREFILHAERTSFYSSNREGIYSCIGFTALYLYSVSVGAILFSERKTVWEWTIFSCGLFCLTLLCWVLLYLAAGRIEPISRRLTNLPYVLWMVGLMLIFITIFLLFDIITIFMFSMREKRDRSSNELNSSRKTNTRDELTVLIERTPPSDQIQVSNKHYFLSTLIQAIDYNQLAYFLLANFLTGFANLLLDTGRATLRAAVCYMIVYELILSYVIIAMHRKKMKLKLF